MVFEYSDFIDGKKSLKKGGGLNAMVFEVNVLPPPNLFTDD